MVKNLPANAGDFDPWVWKISWRRAWKPTPVFLPGESHGQRSLEGYSPWGHKEMDTAEATEHAEPKFHDPSEGLLSLGYSFVYEYSQIILSKFWMLL